MSWKGNRDLSIRRSSDSFSSRARVVHLFSAHQSHLDRAVNVLLAVYRKPTGSARRRRRAVRGVLYARKIYRAGAAGDIGARRLRRAIAESQGVLVGQAEAIHTEFGRHSRLRQIDNLSGEVRCAANAKAA
jgi:hypothetical protein